MFAATAMPAAYNRCWVGANGLPCNRCVGSTDGTRSDDALFVPLAAVRFVYSTSISPPRPCVCHSVLCHS